jgi:hypothetical protein
VKRYIALAVTEGVAVEIDMAVGDLQLLVGHIDANHAAGLAHQG